MIVHLTCSKKKTRPPSPIPRVTERRECLRSEDEVGMKETVGWAGALNAAGAAGGTCPAVPFCFAWATRNKKAASRRPWLKQSGHASLM